MTQTLFDLTGKVAVVTGAGANGGIGHAIALGFAQHGADVAVSDIDDAGAQTTANGYCLDPTPTLPDIGEGDRCSSLARGGG